MKPSLEFGISAGTVTIVSAWQSTILPSDQATIPCGVLESEDKMFYRQNRKLKILYYKNQNYCLKNEDIIFEYFYKFRF
jgi:hypothetical protein